MELKTRTTEGTLTAVFAKPQPPVEVSSVQMLWFSLASRLNKVLVLITTFWAVCLAVGKRMCVYTLRRSQKKMNVVGYLLNYMTICSASRRVCVLLQETRIFHAILDTTNDFLINI